MCECLSEEERHGKSVCQKKCLIMSDSQLTVWCKWFLNHIALMAVMSVSE